MKERALLPIFYNWKAYWKLEPSSFDEIKVYHHHGPKPGNGLETIASCSIDMIGNHPEAYEPLIRQGICCDGGRTARWVLSAHEALSPDVDIC
jgi:hypothetical protein